METVTFGASKAESSSPEETVKSQESVSTDICSKPAESDVNKKKTQHRSHGEDQRKARASAGVPSERLRFSRSSGTSQVSRWSSKRHKSTHVLLPSVGLQHGCEETVGEGEAREPEQPGGLAGPGPQLELADPLAKVSGPRCQRLQRGVRLVQTTVHTFRTSQLY